MLWEIIQKQSLDHSPDQISNILSLIASSFPIWLLRVIFNNKCILYFNFIFLRFYLFLERGKREGEKHWSTRETSICRLLHAPDWEPGPQPRPVPCPGIEPATFFCLWLVLNPQSHTSQGCTFILKVLVFTCSHPMERINSTHNFLSSFSGHEYPAHSWLLGSG